MKTTIFINGLALDKMLFMDILKKIENDNHIKFAREHFAENARDDKRNNYSQMIKEGFHILSPISDILGHGASHVLEIFQDYVIEGVNKLIISLDFNNINYSKYINYDLFNIFLSHISDTQCITSFYNYKLSSVKSNLSNDKLKQIYCDKPYFENKYIDSIDISLKKSPRVCVESIKAIIYNHLRLILYSDEIINNIDNIHELTTHDSKTYLKVLLGKKPSKRPLYGIWLLSEILYRLYNDEDIFIEFDKELFNENNCFRKDFKIKKGDNIDELELAGIDGAFLRECILLAGNPGKMRFCKAGDESLDNEKNLIKVEKINYETSQKQADKYSKNFDFDTLDKLFWRGDHNGFVKMTIPIKTVISLPVHYYKNLTNDSFPEVEEKLKKIFPLPGVNKIVSFDETSNKFTTKDGNTLEFFFLGGGEHNNPLVHFANVLRYADSPSEERKFGLIENAFDRTLKIKKERQYPNFLIGLENSVSGMNAVIRGRATTDAPLPMAVECFSNEAELLEIDLGDYIKGFAIYGFSAPMTRLAFLAFIFASDGYFNIPNLITFAENKAKLCRICEDMKSFWKLLEEEFDPGDLMNNPENTDLIKMLFNNIKTMPYP